MTAYEFYWHDEKKGDNFIGMLPERRKNRERITQESIMNWVRKVISDSGRINNIYFIQVEV